MSALALQSFGFEGTEVRTLDVSGAPWFVAQDVCACLEIVNSRNVVAALDGDEKGVHTVDTLGGAQQLQVVSESGLYALIFKSRKPAAIRFRKWVTGEVLPALRQTGQYQLAANDDAEPVLELDTRDQIDRLLAQCRYVEVTKRVHGGEAAREAWRQVGLPDVRPMRVLLAEAKAEDIEPQIRAWLETRTELSRDVSTAAQDLFADYCRWCEDEKLDPFNQTMFGRTLTACGVMGRKGRRGTTLRRGIRLKD